MDLAPANWDALRTQTRSLNDIFGLPWPHGPFPNPFTYFDATVTIDGQKLARIGVRKKGFLGSLDENKPSLKIKFDESIKGRTFMGMTKLVYQETLNLFSQD